MLTLFFGDPVYRNVAVAAALWYALGLAYFALYGRKHLVYSPEEAFAVKMDQDADSSAGAP